MRPGQFFLQEAVMRKGKGKDMDDKEVDPKERFGKGRKKGGRGKKRGRRGGR